MLSFFRKIIPERSGLRLWYHKISAILAAVWYRFPSHRLRVIAVTGTSGKSTTVELIWYLLQKSGKKCGALSTIQFHFGDEIVENESLRTTLRPWKVQRYLRRMVREECEYAVLEVSSHALDQDRIWGVNVDTAVLTNIADNEHIDYHGTFADYVHTKLQLFTRTNAGSRKPHIPKVFVLNRDDAHFDLFADLSIDKKWTYSRRKPSDIQSHDVNYTPRNTEFDLRIPNNQVHIQAPLIGEHNLENILASIAVAVSHGVKVTDVQKYFAAHPGVSSRLELIEKGQNFSVVVDYTYKPSALRAVLSTLKKLIHGKLIVVWGGAGGRAPENWQQSGRLLHEFADEIVLTTDDPYDQDPRFIASTIRQVIPRQEGAGFFEIEDRYEAIRYALLTAQEDDMVLVAGRGHEKVQTIGKKKIPFVDKEVCEEILDFASGDQLLKKKK
ncbi:UDP-N-acetylmuramoyl-L-alanyl-D-glutamate--2,6-diaminopimelate ligase [Candidatus Gracilibacteria bacterium]|nr:UDP-N-acetylmuramoyl-L-alanyl-D-glutamate--2,6-diaminopimelate ligase [Candidatus Gracilibacteria bacterium]MCF7819419.1 UDP-N-acetylmuramoyl-L-alanyl-D-glutamate--2,6-diaminopimelate ligase [Candidatus Gracilibacteria bacterium]